MDNNISINTNLIFIGRPSFPIGGAMTKRHKYYIDHLASKADLSICNICTWSEGGKNREVGTYKDVVDYYNTTYPPSFSSIPKIAKWANRILESRYRKNFNNIAIFCSYFTIEQIPILLKAKKMGYKIICDVVENYNAPGSDSSKQMKFSFAISKTFLYKKVDGFIVISNLLKQVYKNYGKPTLLLTNSAPITIDENKHKTGYHSPIRIVYTGTYASKDGLSFLIEGFNKFIREEGNVAELILIGKGKGNEKTEKLIADNKQIKRLGFVSDETLAEIQNSADLLCMTRCNSPFANYGFPFKLSEYMATGNPVLATSVGDVSLYIKDKENGLLVNPSDSEAIYKALEYAYHHPLECIKMGRKSLNTIQESFDVHKNGETLFNFIKSFS